MLEQLEHEQLETITLHSGAVEWFEKGKEIIINSTLFDVHSYFTKGDSVTFKGLFDTKETELKAQVRKLFETSGDETANRELIIAKIIVQLWIADSIVLDVSPLNAYFINEYFLDSTGLITTDISIFSPPPESLISFTKA